MQNIFNNVKSSALKVGEYFTPVLKESKFHETGVLTPEEFLAAGDHLVHHCPSWQWASGSEASLKDYLPKEKQFLITRNVPCYKRCSQMMANGDHLEKILEDSEGGWVDTHHFADAISEQVSDMTLDEGGGAEKKAETEVATTGEEDSDQEAVDMEDFAESGLMEAQDPGLVAKEKTKESASGGGETILATRTYDLNITYDKYYQTPRLWLFGYDEDKKALSMEQMYEDFSADHANKTITMETHPHLPGPPQASVHPCRHAQVMKKLIDQIMEGGGELGVHMYLIVFLKFVQAIIPTIEYDFTQNFSL